MTDDLDLEQELRRAAELLDPLPEGLRRHAVEAFGLRALDAELAALTFDSLLDAEASLVRGAEPPRLLTFRSSALTIDVELIDTGRGRRLIGQLDPASPAEIELRTPDRTLTVRADDLGRFTIEDIGAAGPVSIRCRADDASLAVVTEWMSI